MRGRRHDCVSCGLTSRGGGDGLSKNGRGGGSGDGWSGRRGRRVLSFFGGSLGSLAFAVGDADFWTGGTHGLQGESVMISDSRYHSLQSKLQVCRPARDV